MSYMGDSRRAHPAAKLSRKRPRAISFIANWPSDRPLTAEQVANNTGLNINAARKLLDEMRARRTML